MTTTKSPKYRFLFLFVATAAVVSAVMLTLGGAENTFTNSVPKLWTETRVGPLVFFAVLEGLYRDGVKDDGEYREDDANFEPCFSIRKEVAVEGVTVRTLPGGRGLALMHCGPYDQLGRSYAKILQQANEQKLNLALPTREVYVKGPGMIFKGNPKNYLTEIQLPFKA